MNWKISRRRKKQQKQLGNGLVMMSFSTLQKAWKNSFSPAPSEIYLSSTLLDDCVHCKCGQWNRCENGDKLEKVIESDIMELIINECVFFPSSPLWVVSTVWLAAAHKIRWKTSWCLVENSELIESRLMCVCVSVFFNLDINEVWLWSVVTATETPMARLEKKFKPRR